MKPTPTIFLILTIAIFFIYIRPQQVEVNKLKIEEKSLSADNEKAIQYKQKKEQLVSQVRDNISDSQEKRLKKFLPDSVDNVKLLIDLDAIAAELGLSIGNTAFNSGGGGDENRTDTTDQGLYETITLSFSFVSNYEDFKAFLRLLQQSLRLIDVTDITINTSSDPEFATYRFVVNTYWLKR